MPTLKSGTIIPTPEEDKEINDQIEADPNEFEWTDQIFDDAKAFEASDLPASFKAAVRNDQQKAKKYYFPFGITMR